MKTRKAVMWGILVSLFVVCCVFVGLKVSATQEEKMPASDANASKDNSYASLPDKTITLDGKPVSDIGGRKVYNARGIDDFCYPNLPEIMAIEPGEYFTIPTESDKLQNIVGWAETNLLGQRFMSVNPSGQRGASYFVVLYNTGYGAFVWKYLIYVHQSPSHWQLLCGGWVCTTDKPNLIDYPYIDSKKGKLIFGTREGKIIKTVDIASPLVLLGIRAN